MGTYTGWAENHTFYLIRQWKNGFEESFQSPAQNKDSRVPLVPELRIHFLRAQITDSRPLGYLYRLGRKSYILRDTTMEKNDFEEGLLNPAQNKDSFVPLVPELRIHFPRAQIKDSRPHGYLCRLGRKSYILRDTTMEKRL